MIARAEKYVSAYLFAGLLVSFLFSLLISARLLLVSVPVLDVKWVNLVLYDVYYYLMPATAVTLIMLLWCLHRSRRRLKHTKQQGILLSALVILFLFANFYLYAYLDLYAVPSLIKYAFFSSLAPLMIIFFLRCCDPENRRFNRKVATVLIILIIIMPYASAFTSFNYILSTVGKMNNDSHRVAYVSEYVLHATTSIWRGDGYVKFHRAQNDFLKYLIVGVGGCGETAMASTVFFDRLDIESRRVAFPGEDHAFVEVKLNGTWMVVDPGYYGSELLTRKERGLKRVEEFGALSYVIAYADNMFIELTQYYVATDAIVTRVTYEGEPVANAEVFLKHTFLGRETRLPSQEYMFYSDGNGTVVLHMGSLAYNEKAGEVESYFWIYVNGRNTGLNVTSTGSGRIHYVEIDLAEV